MTDPTVRPGGDDEHTDSIEVVSVDETMGHDEAAVDPWVPLGARLSAWFNRRWDRASEDPGSAVEAVVSAIAVLLATGVVLATVRVDLLFQNSTPTGGDMGAHVWGPHFLQHNVLPKFRFTGWTADWYNGFPAYQFYMVVPSLLIVFLHVGLHPVLAVFVAIAALVGGLGGWLVPRLYRFRRPLLVPGILLAVLVLPIPYNISFKVISAIGLITLPVVCWAAAKLADLPFPVPPFAAIASLFFIFNREPLYLSHGNIIGGNFTSTMAGEFAFSISLTISILYLGVAARGLKTGKYRALSAALFALACLCHLIPAFFVLACTGALFLLHPDRLRLRWLATMVPVAGLLTAFWVLPFWWRRDYVNDMGWERLPEPNAHWGADVLSPSGDPSSAWYYLWPPTGMRYLMIAALVGVVVSVIRRYRLGMVLALAWGAVAVAFVVMPQYRLWNARLLPFQYLTVVLLAAIGIGELVRVSGIIASGRVERPYRPISVLLAGAISLAALVAAILPLDNVLQKTGTAFGFERVPVTAMRTKNGEPTEATVTEARFRLFGQTIYASQPDMQPATGWASWNYTGLQGKEPTCTDANDPSTCTGGWPEYRDFVATMAAVGKDEHHGCGRLLWEFDSKTLNTYGTTMALMLLPYWTDGCIGSQEGLYFESTPSVPFHFYMQDELSTSGSRPQRNVTWPGFGVDEGVRHLQLLGVRYYAAVTPQAITAAEQNPDLTQITSSGPWRIYEVADAPTVSALEYEPVVVEGVEESQHGWLPTASAWFQKGDLDVLLALDGPADWKRVQVKPVDEDVARLTQWLNDQVGRAGQNVDPLPPQPRKALPKNEVTNIKSSEETISFDVSRPGVPVLVKTSYFPNWHVKGASRAYRVAPNLMVVVPTDKHVTLTYGRTPPDVIAYGLTLFGFFALWVLARQKPLPVSKLGNGWLSDRIDKLLSLSPKQADHSVHSAWGDTSTWRPTDLDESANAAPPDHIHTSELFMRPEADPSTGPADNSPPADTP